MSVYRYVASESASGRVTRGELTADSPVQVRSALRRMGLAPLRVSEAVKKSASDRPSRRAARRLIERVVRDRRRVALVELYENLAALLESGTPLAESLVIVGGSVEGRGTPTSTLCRALAEDIRAGRSLAAALTSRHDWFGPIDIALVDSAEQSGELPRVLGDLALHHARSDELRGKLAGALAYPALLLVFGVGVVIFLTTNTLPQLAGVLADGGVALPRATAILLALGGFITVHWAWLLPGLLTALAILIYTARRPAFAHWRLRVPLLGPALMRGQVGAASQLLSRLLSCGLPLTEALALTAPTVPNTALRSAFAALREGLLRGESVSMLGTHGVFDPVYLRVLEVGEQRGDLAATLERIGARYRASAARLIDRLAAVLEPAAILLLAAMIGFVVYAAIIPMTRLGRAL